MTGEDKPVAVTIKSKSKSESECDGSLFLNDNDKNLKIRLLNENISFDISSLYNRMRVQDIKMILHHTMVYDRSAKKCLLQSRERIEFENCNLSKYEGRNIDISIKISISDDESGNKNDSHTNPRIITLNIGVFNVISENELQPKDDKDLFKIIDRFYAKDYIVKSAVWNGMGDSPEFKKLEECYKEYKEVPSEEIKNLYFQNGMLKIYYDAVIETLKVNNTKRIAGKASAMCSYLAIKDYLNNYFEDGHEFEVSNPNVFVNNRNTEFDALVVKKAKNNNDKYFFEEDDVEAVIEIKTCGYFSSKDELINVGKKNNGFKEYIENGKLENKKYIYFSISESFGSRAESIHFYEYLFSTMSKDKNEFGIFCGVNKDQNTILIPYEYDLNKLLKEIFK